MAVQTAVVVRAASSAAMVQSYSGSGAAASMIFARALKGGVALTGVRKTGLSSLSLGSNSVRLPVVRPLGRCYSQASKVMASQWRPEATGGFEGHEVEVDSNNEFPMPSTVPWSKEMANTVHLIGNVGRDMVIKYLDTGKVVAKSSLAVQRGSVKKDEPPSWYVLLSMLILIGGDSLESLCGLLFGYRFSRFCFCRGNGLMKLVSAEYDGTDNLQYLLDCF